jgi:hypothetical protein
MRALLLATFLLGFSGLSMAASKHHHHHVHHVHHVHHHHHTKHHHKHHRRHHNHAMIMINSQGGIVIAGTHHSHNRHQNIFYAIGF